MTYFPNPLHSLDGLDNVWIDSKLSLKFKNRTELYITLTNARKWNDICHILNDIPENDIRSLATVLNDCPQWARVIALKQLKATHTDCYIKCMSAISEFQINKAFFDPENTFPCVATDQFFNCFKEGDTLVWSHSQDYSIYRTLTETNQMSKSENKLNIAAYALKTSVILDCIADQSAPSDITNLLVAIGHIPTNRWRRKYMNLFRQLPEHCEWIEQMRGKEYDIMLVGSDVRKLGLHISNSLKYPIDIIIVWLAVVPATQYWRNHNDQSIMDAWRLYSNGNIYLDELMNDDERANIVGENGSIHISKWYQLYGSHRDFEPQNNMFATPTGITNERYLEYAALDMQGYYLSKSNWAYTHNAEIYPIKVLFYLGTEYRPGSGTQLAVARFHQEMVQPWRPRSFHPPLITDSRGREALLLYYYKLTDLELRSCPQTTGLVENSGDSIVLHVKLDNSLIRDISYSIPLDIKNRP